MNKHQVVFLVVSFKVTLTTLLAYYSTAEC